MALTKAQKDAKLTRVNAARKKKGLKPLTQLRKRPPGNAKPKASPKRKAPSTTKKLNGMSKGKAPSAPAGSRLMPMSVQSQAAFQYALALSDPFTAALNTGIPMGQLGLPTFKTTKYTRMVIDSAVAVTTATVGGTVFAATTYPVDVVVSYTSAGVLRFQYSTGGVATTFQGYSDMVGGNPTLVNGRVVAASIRIQRMGRRDDAGLKYGIRRTCNDGLENQPGFTSNDFFQVNYHPKNNWDVEYKIPASGHPTNFETNFGLTFAGMVNSATAYEIECIAIVESNQDTPPANVYDHSQYTLTVNGITRNASTDVFPERLSSVSKAAGLNRYITPSLNHQDPHAKLPENTITTVSRDQVNAVGLGSRMDSMFWDAINKTGEFGYSVYNAIPSIDSTLDKLDQVEQSIIYGAELAEQAKRVAARAAEVALIVKAVIP